MSKQELPRKLSPFEFAYKHYYLGQIANLPLSPSWVRGDFEKWWCDFCAQVEKDGWRKCERGTTVDTGCPHCQQKLVEQGWHSKQMCDADCLQFAGWHSPDKCPMLFLTKAMNDVGRNNGRNYEVFK